MSDLPPHIRFLAMHAAFGIGLGVAIAALLILTNAVGLRTLLIESESPLPAIVLLAGGFAITFGSLSMGAAIMMLGRGASPDDDTPSRGHAVLQDEALKLAVVPARAARRPRHSTR